MGDRPMPNPAYSAPRMSTSGVQPPSYAMVAGRPDIPMPGGMPAAPPQMPAPSYAMVAGRPELPPIGQPNLTPEQIQQLLMRLGLQSAGNVFGGGMR